MYRNKLLVFLLMLLIACSFIINVSATENPIKIGAIFPLTGTCAKPGTGCAHALELAFEEINENGGVFGRPLKLIIEDDEGQPTTSVSAAEKLCVEDQVVAVIGPFNSSCCLAHMQVTKREKCPQVDPVAFASAITRPFNNPYMFRNILNAQTIGTLFAEFILRQSGAKKLVILRENTDYGLDFEKFISERVEEEPGVDIISVEVYNPGDTDFYTQLTKIKNLKPDVVVMIANIAESSQIMKQSVDLGLEIPFYATGSSATQQFIDLAGDAGNGLYSLSFTEVHPDDPPIKTKFIKKYAEKFGVPADMFAIATYDAAYIVAEGLKNLYKNNNEKWPEDVAEFRAKLRDGIAEIDGLQLCQGKLVWNKYQESATDVFFIQWQDGKKVIIERLKAEDCVIPGEERL